ncbi:cyclophilin-like fold protein [Exiguobacterium aurantiacum]|uniref:Cyclophilin-like fold protein n=1 Tax=Exiguobacterium aurantiacum TaxID=33987 RepID=A0ABY5FPE3_9BACL|nr:cyclophilin-like fold protein [Exiguobacterium aurantiacum]UTT43468.1 cyclophilin-like fold protein [Exiguobacterium aurantiacum]
MNAIRLGLVASMLFLAGCGDDAVREPENQEGVTSQVETIPVSVRFEDNPTAEALQDRLPLTLSMQDLHQNEKYFYFDEPFPTNPERVGSIRAGDVMLYGDDCLVLFYEDVETSYAYTRIGRVENFTTLAPLLGSGTVELTFQN